MRINLTLMCKLASLVFCAAVYGISCTPDNPFDNGKEEEINTDFQDSLTLVLNRQAKAMRTILSSETPVQVVSFKQLQKGEKDGLYEVGLSSELTFQVYVGRGDNFVEPMTCTHVEGVAYWAYVDTEGVVLPFEDEQGNKHALASDFSFEVKKDEYSVKIADKIYELGYTINDDIQVFECEMLNDPSGEFYGLRFYFGNDNVKTVYFAEYAGVYFYLPEDAGKSVVTELFVADGGTNMLSLAIFDGIDYKYVAPEGWSVSETEEGLVSVLVTAPESYDVDVETPLELTVVATDDSFVFATVVLTDQMFRSLALSATGPVIVPTPGLGKFAYGIALDEEYNEDEVLALGGALISGSQPSEQGAAVSTTAVSKTFEEVLGEPLDEDKRYVLWAVAEDQILSKGFGKIVVNFDSPKSYLLDAELNVQVKGAEHVYMGVIENVENVKAEILDQLQMDALDYAEVPDVFEYNGKATEFTSTPGYENGMRYDTEYLVWVVPAVSGEYTYTEDDIFSYPIKTNAITPGGDLEITCGEIEVSPSTLKFPLSSPGAAMICYAFFNNNEGMMLSGDPDEDKYNAITEAKHNGRLSEAKESFTDKVDAYASNLNDEGAVTYWVAAFAVDADGKYGKVYCESATTLKLDYDKTIELKVVSSDITSNSAKFTVTATKGKLTDDYIYWVGRESDPFYGLSYLGGTKKSAEKYMALNPDDENILKCMRKYGELSEDGSITITDMTMDTKYVFFILQKGERYYSEAGYGSATTSKITLGDVVKQNTQKWNETKNKINIAWEEEEFHQGSTGLMSYYSFKFSCPTDLTAYVMCASVNYFEDMGLNRMDHVMVEIEEYTSRKLDKDHTVDDEDGNIMSEPDYYKDGVLKQGSLMSVNDFYVHGSPYEGAVTYFATGKHDDKSCPTWEDGHCANYKRAQEMIAYYSSIEPWNKRASAFGLTGDEATAWANALYNAYAPFYKDAKPIIYINDGAPLRITTHYATGVDDEGNIPDRVVVMLKDLQGNYYEPMFFEVPNYFKK